MTDTVIVGDLHGKWEIVEEVLSRDTNVVFVGDYLDSFGEPVEDQIKTLTMVLDAIEKDPKRVQGLLGNHELSYLINGMECSGYRGETQALVSHLESRINKLLKEYTWVGDYLITHAGLTREAVPESARSLVGVREFMGSDEFHKIKYNISASRGGNSRFPGIFWCDWWKDLEAIEGVKQVVGHTAYRPNKYEGAVGVLSRKGSFNVDCLDHIPEVLRIDAEGNPHIETLDVQYRCGA